MKSTVAQGPLATADSVGMANRCRVLLVDDDPMVLRSIARVLATHYAVTPVENIAAARIVLTGAPPPDVLVTDLRLSATERGEDLLALAKAEFPEMGRIALSGSEERFAALIADDRAVIAIGKGAHPEEIVAAVRGMCTCTH